MQGTCHMGDSVGGYVDIWENTKHMYAISMVTPREGSEKKDGCGMGVRNFSLIRTVLIFKMSIFMRHLDH